MVEALIICSVFLGIASVIAVPLAVLIGLPLTAWLGRSWLRLKEQEVDLRRLEVAVRMRESHFERLPAYVDEGDPQALLAWARTGREIAALRLHASGSGSDPEASGH